MDVAVKLGQRGYCGGAKPEDAGEGGEEQQHQEADAGPEKNLRPAAFATRLERRGRRLRGTCWK